MREWVAFWNSEHSVYANARHRDVHYRTIAEDIRAYVPGPDATVLDYGCGEALHADLVAGAARRLILCEAAAAVRERLTQRFSGNDKIEIASPESLAAMPDGALDLAVVNSVAQYMAPADLDALFVLLRRLLRPNGRLVLGDIIPPTLPLISDVGALLRFAARNGFLAAAMRGLARTALSDYRRLRMQLGVSRYEESAMLAKLGEAGFSAVRAPKNIGHNPARMTFIATPR